MARNALLGLIPGVGNPDDAFLRNLAFLQAQQAPAFADVNEALPDGFGGYQYGLPADVPADMPMQAPRNAVAALAAQPEVVAYAPDFAAYEESGDFGAYEPPPSFANVRGGASSVPNVLRSTRHRSMRDDGARSVGEAEAWVEGMIREGRLTPEQVALYRENRANRFGPAPAAMPRTSQEDPRRYDSRPGSDMPMNSFRVESGPNAGKTRSMNFADSSAPESGLQPDLSQPIEIAGVGKGYWEKGGTGNAIIDGKRVMLGVDRNATNKRQAQEIALAQGRQNLRKGEVDIAKDLEAMFASRAARLGERGAAAEDRKKREAAYNAGLKEVAKDDKDVAAASQLESAYNEWATLNPSVTTGRIMGNMPAIGQPERQRLQQLENFLSMNAFKPGQGAMTNFERGLIKGAGPSLLNDAEVNNDIVKIGLGAVQNLKDRANFREAWLQQKGNLLGADAAWQEYLEANPRYVRNEAGRIVDNLKRMDWRGALRGGETASGSISREQAIAELRRRGKLPNG